MRTKAICDGPAGDQHHWPVEQPGRLGAGHGVKEFICLWSQGGILEHGPSKVPLLYSSRCNRITVDYGLQVGNDPGTIDNQFNDKRCKRNDKRQRHKSSIWNTCYYRGFSSTLWTIQWSYLYSLLLQRCKLTRWRSPGCTCRGTSEEHYGPSWGCSRGKLLEKRKVSEYSYRSVSFSGFFVQLAVTFFK